MNSARQSMRRVIVGLFPWITGVVAVASAKGKGLAIRAAGGLLHLMGGPEDPAVHRVGDLGSAGRVEAVGNTVTFKDPSGNTIGALSFTSPDTVITVTASPITGIDLITKATEGSQKVTCA